MAVSNQTRPDLAEPTPLDLVQPHKLSARSAIVRRLCEIVCWPESRIPAYERQLAADILVGLLRTSNIELRRQCAAGLVMIQDAPKALLRYLARDEIDVAGPLLENGVGFDDSDLVAAVRSGVLPHWMALAKRRNLGEAVTDALMQTGDIAVMEAVLRNQFAKLSTQGVSIVVACSRQAPSLPGLLVKRNELRPTQALVLFWWANFEARVHILRRFAVDRSTLIQELGDVFRIAAQEGWADADARTTLQVIERRQRNRAAAAQSPYGSLEGAIAAAEQGLDKRGVSEIAHLAGIKPTTAAQIFSDPGGEAIAVFCKAAGLKRIAVIALWRALRRPMGDVGSTNNALGRTLYVFDTLATAKAQTVLRYWNWSFTADAVNLEPISMQDGAADMPVARRNASLLFQRQG